MRESKKDIQSIILLVGGILNLIKSVFTEYGYDSSYHIALSWRHINGDRLLREIWEPHQTSAFTLDLPMLIYRFFVPSMTGVALFLQILGAVIYFIVVWFLYKTLSKFIDRKPAAIISFIILICRPKGVTLIEFSNALMIFSIILFISLVNIFRDKGVIYYILAAISTCLMIIVYPSCLVLIIPLFVILFRKNKRYAFSFLITGVFIGLGYSLYVLLSVGPEDLMTVLKNVTSGDSTHGTKTIASIFGGYKDYPYLINVLFPILMVFGLINRKKLEPAEKQIWDSAFIISLSVFCGVMLLTNQGIFTAFGYLVLSAAFSLVPLSRALTKSVNPVYITICILLFVSRGLFIINGYSALNGRFIFNVENIIRVGPTAGIVAPLQIVNESKESIYDFEQAVTAGDSVLAVGNWIVDSIVYLYTDAEISNYSTIDTTTYSEKLAEYWDLYPKKRPTVVAVKAYEGDYTPDDSFIGKMLKEKYETAYVGKQWVFYRNK